MNALLMHIQEKKKCMHFSGVLRWSNCNCSTKIMAIIAISIEYCEKKKKHFY